ncbi:ribosomal protection-like ABC-F family protein [Brassicibacter mesophilus]|uniref:ribosomal protection-like ABC-F family protein n=1 Tax=Brassicibacter mesophilus TaxID=745119 RepID=UPI003D25870B
MIEIALKDVNKYYGANKVFDNITFEVHTEEKVGLIGRNGTGKTTVLKIIAGIEKHDEGNMSIKKDATIGYLDQIPEYPESCKVIDVLNMAFKEQFEIREKMSELEKEMSSCNTEDLELAMKRYGELQYLFEHMGGYEIDEKLSKICTGLKISEEFKERYFSTLSGGEKTTIMLGRMLLQNPDILLLDEPSNHLDMDSIEWLEEFLKDYKGAVLIISHDRYFLDRVVNKIIEIEDGETSLYLGNYSYYLQEKDRRILEQFEAYKDQQKKIKAMEEAIKRFRDWGTRSDDPRMFKKAANMQKRIERMDKVARPSTDRPKIQINFSGNERSGKDVIKVVGLRKLFDDKAILDGLDFHVRFAEKVCIVGKNGSGKSTLLKILLNEYAPDSGCVEIGSRVKVGYLEQQVLFEDENLSILDTLKSSFTMTEGNARRILAKFLFFGEDVFKKVKNLSGGEKSRLKLCLLMQKDINLLVLDEPTNHLDIESREMLEEALEQFNGSIVFVSHDRYFINKIAQRLVEINNKKLKEYLGGYDYYREKKLEEKIKMEAMSKKAETKIHEIKPRQETQKSNKTTNKWKEKSILELEDQIEDIETQIKQKNQEMEVMASDYEKLKELFSEKEELQNKLDELMEKWIEMSS